MTATTCGVLVTDGTGVLLGHATRSPRWDIPKGVAEPGEALAAAAARELREETGLEVAASALMPRGVHRYLPGKDLALFEWRPLAMPDPATLRCTSYFTVGHSQLPEFDRFGIFDWPDAVSRLGRNMARVLASVMAAALSPGDSAAPTVHAIGTTSAEARPRSSSGQRAGRRASRSRLTPN